MEEVLKKQLTMQIEQQLEVSVKDVKTFTIPYSIVDVNYTPMIKKRMDILMKMLLTSYRSGAFTNAEQLASILMVESLFIHDLTRQMERSELISSDANFALTSKGEEQLAQGIYEEQLPETNIELMYSALHEQFFFINSEELELMDELPEPLSYFEEQDPYPLQEQLIVAAIQKELSKELGEIQVQSINSMDVVELYDFPISLFICYDQKNDRLFSRAYNVYLHEWDEVVAAYMDQKDVLQWRKQYL